MKGYVYILQSLKDGNKYIGSTISVKERVEKHNKGYVKSTKSRRPLILENVLEYEGLTVARQKEILFKRSHDTLLKELRQRGVVHR